MNYRILRGVEPPPPEAVSIARDVTFVRAHLDPHLTDPSSSAPHCSSSAQFSRFAALVNPRSLSLYRYVAYHCFDPILLVPRGSSKRAENRRGRKFFFPTMDREQCWKPCEYRDDARDKFREDRDRRRGGKYRITVLSRPTGYFVPYEAQLKPRFVPTQPRRHIHKLPSYTQHPWLLSFCESLSFPLSLRGGNAWRSRVTL